MVYIYNTTFLQYYIFRFLNILELIKEMSVRKKIWLMKNWSKNENLESLSHFNFSSKYIYNKSRRHSESTVYSLNGFSTRPK